MQWQRLARQAAQQTHIEEQLAGGGDGGERGHAAKATPRRHRCIVVVWRVACSCAARRGHVGVQPAAAPGGGRRYCRRMPSISAAGCSRLQARVFAGS